MGREGLTPFSISKRRREGRTGGSNTDSHGFNLRDDWTNRERREIHERAGELQMATRAIPPALHVCVMPKRRNQLLRRSNPIASKPPKPMSVTAPGSGTP